MSRLVDDATLRVRFLLATALGAALLVLLPALLDTAADGRGPVALAVLALALAAVTRLGLRCVALTTRTASRVLPRDDAPPTLSARVTDPVHHPLRPRAPGPA